MIQQIKRRFTLQCLDVSPSSEKIRGKLHSVLIDFLLSSIYEAASPSGKGAVLVILSSRV